MKGNDMTTLFPALLTVFFDGRCAMCRNEMAEIAKLDAAHELRFVDCSAGDFDARAWLKEGVSRADLMAALHVRDVLGDWHRGPDAVGLLYATVGAPVLARLWTHPVLRPLMRRLYPWVARHRYVLSSLGLSLISPWVLRLFARRAHVATLPHSPVCDHGACDVRWLVRH
jgi:predicted DCC family thiol-disulfide oxidoreductase YuxK